MSDVENIRSLEELREWVSSAGLILTNGGVAGESLGATPFFSPHHICNSAHLVRMVRLYGGPDETAFPKGCDDLRWSDDTFWVVRESLRFAQGRKQPRFYRLAGRHHPELWWHFPSVAITDPTKVAFTPSHEYGKRDRRVVMAVGRYLTKFYSDVFTEGQIRDLANAEKGYEVQWADTAEDMVWVYENGPDSCMVSGFDTCTHPVATYASGEFRLAWFKLGDIAIARALVHEPSKKWVRAYGNEADALIYALEELGYDKADGWGGAKLKRIFERGEPVLPYLDGEDNYVYDDGEFFVVCGDEAEADYQCDCTNGRGEYVGGVECSYCGGRIRNDGYTNTEDGGQACDECWYNHGTVAQGRWGSEYVMHIEDDDNYAYCEDDCRWYRDDDRVLAEYNIVRCEVTGDLRTSTNVVGAHAASVHAGEYVGREYAWLSELCDSDGDQIYLTADDVTLDDRVIVKSRHEDGSIATYGLVHSDFDWLTEEDKAQCVVLPTMRSLLAVGALGRAKFVDAEGRGDGEWYPGMTRRMQNLLDRAEARAAAAQARSEEPIQQAA